MKAESRRTCDRVDRGGTFSSKVDLGSATTRRLLAVGAVLFLLTLISPVKLVGGARKAAKVGAIAFAHTGDKERHRPRRGLLRKHEVESSRKHYGEHDECQSLVSHCGHRASPGKKIVSGNFTRLPCSASTRTCRRREPGSRHCQQRE